MTEAVQEQEIEAEAIIDEPVVEPVVEEKPEWSDDEVEEAKAFGWKSPDEWQGDVPSGYIDDPRRYLERAENFRPFKALKQRFDSVESTYAERIRKLEAVSETAMKSQREQHEREIDTIRQQKREAVDSADVEAYDRLDKREKSLSPPQEQVTQPQVDPHVERAYKDYTESENGAWVKNPMLREMGGKLIDAARSSGVALNTPEDQFAYAEVEMRKMYPAYFPTKEVKAVPKQRVDAGGLAGGSSKANGAFSKLPPEAKSAFSKFVNEGLFKDNDDDRKRYSDDYNAA